jgi:hypothetical protein
MVRKMISVLFTTAGLLLLVGGLLLGSLTRRRNVHRRDLVARLAPYQPLEPFRPSVADEAERWLRRLKGPNGVWE